MRNTLIEARGKKTQMYASSEIGISQKYLSKLELGQRTPSLKIAIKIASYYKKSVEELFPDIFLLENSPNSSIKRIISHGGEDENGKYNRENQFQRILQSTVRSRKAQ